MIDLAEVCCLLVTWVVVPSAVYLISCPERIKYIDLSRARSFASDEISLFFMLVWKRLSDAGQVSICVGVVYVGQAIFGRYVILASI